MADVVLKRHCKLLSFFYNYNNYNTSIANHSFHTFTVLKPATLLAVITVSIVTANMHTFGN